MISQSLILNLKKKRGNRERKKERYHKESPGLVGAETKEVRGRPRGE
jgi:hypothetical protein